VVINDITVGKTGHQGRESYRDSDCCRARFRQGHQQIEIDSLVLTQKAVRKIPAWTKTGERKRRHRSRRSWSEHPARQCVVRLDKVSFGPFDARLRLNSKGEPRMRRSPPGTAS